MNKANLKKKRVSNKAPNYLQNPGISSPVYRNTGPLNSCNPGSMYSEKKFSPSDPLVSLVVQNYHSQWRYVRVDRDQLYTTGEVVVYHESYASELLEIAKRVVLDDAIPVDERIIPATARVLRVKHAVEDITSSLFDGSAEVREFAMMAAVTKLTDAEARLLGLERIKSKQRLMHNPELHNDDKRLMLALSDQFGIMSLNHQMNHLGKS